MKLNISSIMLQITKVCITALCLISLSGCGFYSFAGASIPAQATTFSVANFSNMSQDATMPGLTNMLTEALKDLFLKQTKLSLVQADGDFAFEGQIQSYRVSPTAITSNDVAAQERLTITVKVVFKNRYDDPSEPISFDQTFSQYAEYPTGSTNFASAESGLVEEIVEKLVEDIFNASAAHW